MNTRRIDVVLGLRAFIIDQFVTTYLAEKESVLRKEEVDPLLLPSVSAADFVVVVVVCSSC